MTDHSNQIGVEKVLQILGIRASNLPAPGQTLSSKDMVVLAVIPGQDWKREDVRRAYKVTADRIGPPRYLLTDGAVELFETADVLEKPGKKLTVLRDMKHFAANTFEKLIGKDKRFTSCLSKLGRTRSQIQQTERGHFNPASQKPQARFMNGSSRILVASIQNGGVFEASTPASSGSLMGVQKAVSAEQRSSRLPAPLARYWRAIGALSTGISLPKLRPRRA